ncbi:unnamed protein product [Rotaria sp. Silwood2]|nr:unnamed protein product [Rotaria sp. Silwood2]
MESTIEKIRKYCREDYSLDGEIIELWTKVLSQYDLSTLGDEKWFILEQVFKSALHCSNEPIARECLKQLQEKFETTSPRIIKLNAIYFESIGQYEKAEQISLRLIENDEANIINKFIDLTNFLLDTCTNLPDFPSSCLKSIKQYCRQISEMINNDSTELNDFTTPLKEMKDLIEPTNINDLEEKN